MDRDPDLSPPPKKMGSGAIDTYPPNLQIFWDLVRFEVPSVYNRTHPSNIASVICADTDFTTWGSTFLHLENTVIASPSQQSGFRGGTAVGKPPLNFWGNAPISSS